MYKLDNNGNIELKDGKPQVISRGVFEYEISNNRINPINKGDKTTPKERFIQLFQVFNKLKNIYTKTIIEKEWNEDLGTYTMRYKNVDQSSSETYQSTIDLWNSGLINSKLINEQTGEYDLEQLEDIQKEFKVVYDALNKAKSIDSLAIRYTDNSDLYNRAINKIVELYNKLGINIDLDTLNRIVYLPNPDT